MVSKYLELDRKYNDLDPEFQKIGLEVDGKFYQAFDDGGYAAWHDVNLADKYPDHFTMARGSGNEQVAVLRIAKTISERHRFFTQKNIVEAVENDLKKGGIRKAFMVWATGHLDAEVPRIPRPWDYKLTLPKLVRKS